MSGKELADHLNRNNIKTGYGEEFQGGVGTFTLIAEAYRWAKDQLGQAAADKIAEVFVT